MALLAIGADGCTTDLKLQYGKFEGVLVLERDWEELRPAVGKFPLVKSGPSTIREAKGPASCRSKLPSC